MTRTLKIDRLWKNLFSLKDYDVNSGDTLEVTVVGLTGKMLMTPERLKAEQLFASRPMPSKLHAGQTYRLINYAWKPDENTIS